MKTKPFAPVKSADRVFDILEALVKHKGGLNVRELGKQLNIADSSIHALVHTMLNRNYLTMDESRKLSLGPKFYEFSNMMPASSLITLAKPLMKQLKNKFNENVHLAVLDGLDVVYIAYEESNKPIRFHMHIGKVQSAHITGVGKMMLSAYSDDQIRKFYKEYPFEKLTSRTIAGVDELLAELKRIRKRGYSVDDGESFEGSRCFAAPIYDAGDKMIASISISIPYVQPGEDRDDEMISSIRETARSIHSLLKETL